MAKPHGERQLIPLDLPTISEEKKAREGDFGVNRRKARMEMVAKIPHREAWLRTAKETFMPLASVRCGDGYEAIDLRLPEPLRVEGGKTERRMEISRGPPSSWL